MTPTRRNPSVPKVALFLSLFLKGHRDCLSGILDYVRLHGPWHLHLMEGRIGEQKLIQIRTWGCTGIIASPQQAEVARLISEAHVPTVLLAPSPERRGAKDPLAACSRATVDSGEIGRVAAEYFLDKHYTHFAFVGETRGLHWSQERKRGFMERLREAGHTCSAYDRVTPAERQDWAVEQPRLQAWLARLPKSVGLFAAMDGRGRQVIEACMGAGLVVPDQVAVLGVDNDELLCEATFPPMSSIETDLRGCGYRMAEHLAERMRNKRAGRQSLSAGPLRIVLRRSTDTTADADKPIRDALAYIRENACRTDLHVPDVVPIIGGSRRFAEKRFKSIVGRTILDEILRVRLDQVCALLCGTRLSIGEITRRSRFSRESYLARLFKRRFGVTMTRYRASHSSLT